MTANETLEKDRRSPTKERSHRSFFGRNSASNGASNEAAVEEGEGGEEDKGRPTKWSMGVLNDRTTHEVPGSVLLLTGDRNEPLGLRNAPATTSHSSLPSQFHASSQSRREFRQSKSGEGKKKTKDGAIILEPQPDDSHNDPLNWPAWRRDAALLSLGFYCMVGGGMTPILAAGFTNVAKTYHITTPQVALTTGLYMMGLGVGSVFASPTAILFGKRVVYLFGAILFIATSVWCAASPSYVSLLVARIFQGIAVSPVECLPSATIAEIFFLHERAYRIGIYTLLLLGGKNLVPLVSAAIIQGLSWRWVFWIVAMIVGFCWILLFLFVPETFWDRTPRPKSRGSNKKNSGISLFGYRKVSHAPKHDLASQADGSTDGSEFRRITALDSKTSVQSIRPSLLQQRPTRSLHVGFVPDEFDSKDGKATDRSEGPINPVSESPISPLSEELEDENQLSVTSAGVPRNTQTDREAFEGHISLDDDQCARMSNSVHHQYADQVVPAGGAPLTHALHNFNSPFYTNVERLDSDYLKRGKEPSSLNNNDGGSFYQSEESRPPLSPRYTSFLREHPQLTFIQQLKPWNGRLHHDNWFRVAIRPFILFAYPAVLWSSLVYACSIGWLIVLSESVAIIYRNKNTYNFSALSTGLIYLSPFIGGILGTAVAGKLSDVIVRAMSKRNGGLYEPEFRLVMALPVAVSTFIGLIGFGWSAQEHDAWIVPTAFFGIISFGCSLGSTTAITFCVDSYRQYAGEALVTLNFSKNIFHGLVFSLFFTKWLESDGSRTVFIWVGVIQLIAMAFSVPMYIWGKRARMWTVRKNLMEKF